MKINVKNTSKYLLTIRPNNGLKGENIRLAKNTKVVFENESNYARYEKCLSAYKASGKIEIIVGEVKVRNKVEPVKEPDVPPTGDDIKPPVEPSPEPTKETVTKKAKRGRPKKAVKTSSSNVKVTKKAGARRRGRRSSEK